MSMMSKAVAILCLTLALGVPSPCPAQWRPDGYPVAALQGQQAAGQIVADGSGGAYIVWRDYRISQNADVYMQHIDSYGRPLWAGNGIAVAEGPSQQGSPCVCLLTSGLTVVAYTDNANGSDDIYAQCIDDTGNLLWDEGVRICMEAGHQNVPRIVAGISGDAIISWDDQRSGNKDFYAQRVNPGGVTQWTTGGVVICNAANVQDDMQMIADGSGGAILVWEDYRDATNLVLYAQKISSAGAVQWTANGVRLCGGAYWQNQPRIIPDGSGGAIVTWYDMRYGANNDIFAQRVMSGGNVVWTSNGKYVCLTAGEQTWPDLAPDGAGGAIVAWTDDRTSPPYTDIYAQRINSSGDAQWGAGGLPVSDPAGSQKSACVISDGAGGAVIAWQDQRPGSDSDIYAQRINGSGATQWLMQGAGVSGAINTQYLPRIATDGAGGAIITWTDLRDDASSDYDIYAQRMEKHGNWGYPSPWIVSGSDVPHDQGGRVLLTWEPSYLDAFPAEFVTHYVIWRSTDGAAFSPVDSIDAYYLDAYQYAAETTADSTYLGDAPHWFKVRANTPSTLYFWESNVLICHSIDNLHPAAPTALIAEQSHEPAGLSLAWEYTGEPDLDHFAVYRGTGADFTPGAGNLITVPVEASCFDPDWRWDGGFCYKVSAVDIHGNESLFASIAFSEVTGDGIPGAPPASWLAQNYPNPFNPATSISFAMSVPAHVSLRIYDAAGRLVRVLVDEARAAAVYEEVWDGRGEDGSEAASGVYFYKLETGSFSETRKMIMLR